MSAVRIVILGVHICQDVVLCMIATACIQREKRTLVIKKLSSGVALLEGLGTGSVHVPVSIRRSWIVFLALQLSFSPRPRLM